MPLVPAERIPQALLLVLGAPLMHTARMPWHCPCLLQGGAGLGTSSSQGSLGSCGTGDTGESGADPVLPEQLQSPLEEPLSRLHMQLDESATDR